MEVRQLERRAEEWVHDGRRHGSLLSQAELSATERWLNAEGVEGMLHEERMFAFLEASRWALERRRLLRQLAIARRLAVSAVLLAGAIGAILWLLR
jgi:hypothetical protein